MQAPVRSGVQVELPRYERPREDAVDCRTLSGDECVPYSAVAGVISASSLSPGSRTLLRGLLRLGLTRQFPGGGVGIEYGSLLKTAARPEYMAEHVAEAAAHLREQGANLLIVPGMSGYPVGAMYSVVAGLPAVLLKKAKLAVDAPESYPPGAFVIPSYTGDGDVVMHADQEALQDIVDTVVEPQLAAQADVAEPTLRLRVAGADDIIDKATMSLAVSDSARVVGRAAIEDFVGRLRARTGDLRNIHVQIEIVAWVTPLIKGYNGPFEFLSRTIGVRPFAGVNVSSVHLDPPAIGVEGVGILGFARS